MFDMGRKRWLLSFFLLIILFNVGLGKPARRRCQKQQKKANIEKNNEENKKGTIRISGPWGSDSGLDRNVDPMEDSYVKKVIASNEGINFNKDIAEAGEVFDVNGIEDFYDKNALITYEVNGHEVPVHMKPKYTPQTQPLFPEYGHDSPDAISAANDARREQAKKPHATTFYGLSMKDMPEYGVKDTQSVGSKTKPPSDASSHEGITHHFEPDQYLKDLKVFQGDIFHKHTDREKMPTTSGTQHSELLPSKADAAGDKLSAEYAQAEVIAKESSRLMGHDMESDDRHRSESESMREAAENVHDPRASNSIETTDGRGGVDMELFHSRHHVLSDASRLADEAKIKALKSFYQHEDSPSHITPIENPSPSGMATADAQSIGRRINPIHSFVESQSHDEEGDAAADDTTAKSIERERNEALLQSEDNAKFFDQLQKIHQYREKERASSSDEGEESQPSARYHDAEAVAAEKEKPKQDNDEEAYKSREAATQAISEGKPGDSDEGLTENHEHKKQAKAKLLSILGELTSKLKGMEATVKSGHGESRDETAEANEERTTSNRGQHHHPIIQQYRDSDLKPRPQPHSLEDITDHPAGRVSHHEIVDSLFRADENANNEPPIYRETGLQQPIEVKSQPASSVKEEKGDDDFPDYNEVKDAATFEQNLMRKRYHSEALRWSDDLSDRAMKAAQELAKRKPFELSNIKRQPGENVALVKHSSLNVGKDAADQWAKEGNKFDFVSPIMTKKNSDFVQMLWKGSKEYGMGVAKSDAGDWIVVAMYDTPAADDYTEIKHNIEPDQPVVDPYGDIAR